MTDTAVKSVYKSPYLHEGVCLDEKRVHENEHES